VKKIPRIIIYFLSITTLLFAFSQAYSSDLPTLADYDKAVRTNDIQKIRYLRSYIVGAVDTHLHYSKMLKNWTSFNALCTGKSKLRANELGAIFELKIMSLKQRYGEDIMGMPIVEVVPMIVEEHYRCF
jgi:hypothetical protein